MTVSCIPVRWERCSDLKWFVMDNDAVLTYILNHRIVTVVVRFDMAHPEGGGVKLILHVIFRFTKATETTWWLTAGNRQADGADMSSQARARGLS